MESSWIRDQTNVSCTGRWILYHWAARETQGSVLRITFQRDGSQVLKKDISWVLNLARGNLYMFQRGKNCNGKSSSASALRIGSYGAHSKEENDLKFSQSGENIKALLVIKCMSFTPSPSLNCLLWKWKWKSFSRVRHFATPWAISPWSSTGQNTVVGSLSLLQRTLPTQGSNPGILHCGWILYQLSHQGLPPLIIC